MRVADGVHRIEASLGERYVAIYLLVGEDHGLIIDTGVIDSIPSTVEPYLRAQGIDPAQIDHVLSTHCDFDHIGGNGAARELFPSARFIAHVLDQPLVENVDLIVEKRYGEFIDEHGYDDVTADEKANIRDFTRTSAVDWCIVGGERLRLEEGWNVEFVHTPGHSWGSTSVWDPRSGTLFIGDAALGSGLKTHDGRPAFPPTYRYVEAYRATIDRLSAFRANILATSHFPLYHGTEAAAFLALSAAYADRVESAVLTALRVAGRPLSTLEIVEDIHPSLGAWPNRKELALTYAVVGHLEWLAEYGRVEKGHHQTGLASWESTP